MKIMLKLSQFQAQNQQVATEVFRKVRGFDRLTP